MGGEVGVTLFENYILTMFDFFAVIIISRKLLGKKTIIDIRGLIIVLIIPFFTALTTNSLGKYHSFFIIAMVSVVMLKCIYRKSITSTFWIYIISSFIISCIQFLTLIPLNLILDTVEYNFETGIIAQTISLVLFLATYYFAPINILYNFIQSKNRIFNMILINSFLIIITILFYWYADNDQILQNITLFLSISIIFIFINLVTIRSGLILNQQKGQIHIYENYLPIVDELIKELRAKQHEFDNHIQAISMLGDTCLTHDELVNELKKYSNYIISDNEIAMLLKLKNKILAGFIYSKYKQAQEKGILLEVIIHDYMANTNVEDYKLVEIMGTLIDNAIEAVEEQKFKNEKIILNINSYNNKMELEVKNKSPYINTKIISKIFNKGFSTKESKDSKRGYGLYNLKNIVDINNGKVSVFNEEDNNDNNWIVFNVLI